MAVDPVLLVVTQIVCVNLASCHHIIPQLAVHHVAVNIESLGEAVEVLQLLLLSESRRQDFRIQQTNVSQGGGVTSHSLSAGPLVTPIPLVGDLVISQAVSPPSGLNVPTNVFGLFFLTVRRNLKFLNQTRPRTTDNKSRQQHQYGRDGRNTEIVQNNRTKKGHCDNTRNNREQHIRRQNRIDVGVATAVKHAVVSRQQIVAIKPVAGCAHKHPQAGERC